jgi:hypothetical protein
MEVPCYVCNTVTTSDVPFEVKSFICPKCRSVYFADSDKQLRMQHKLSDTILESVINVGTNATIKDVEYTVAGSLTKTMYAGYYWTEYMLCDASGNFIYLTESDGHWVLLKEIEDQYEVSRHPRILNHNDIEMRLYDYGEAKIATGAGFFDFEIPKNKVHTIEYIEPPYMISIESMNGEESTYFGEHISRKEIGNAFPDVLLPQKSGFGIVQPFPLNVKNAAMVFCVVAILIFATHWLAYRDRAEVNVMRESLAFDEFNNKEYISPSFTLDGGSAPLTIGVHSDVDNTWANVQVALVDELASTEVYASKDVEYYHGYTEGESWSEGSNSEEFNICGVKAGKYHLVITPMKAQQDFATHAIDVSVVWNEPSFWNIKVPLIVMLILLVVFYYVNVHLERQRWADSDHSPYEE